MKAPKSVRATEEFSRTRLSQSFFMRDFLFSEIAAVEGLSNLPDDPELAIAAGRGLCENLLEPLQATFGRIAIRSAYRSPEVNDFGCRHRLSCASNERNRARHTWDRRSKDGRMGALTTIVVPWLVDREWTRRAGKQWHGGFMTIFHTASCNSFRSCSLSISVGTRHRSGRSTASRTAWLSHETGILEPRSRSQPSLQRFPEAETNVIGVCLEGDDR